MGKSEAAKTKRNVLEWRYCVIVKMLVLYTFSEQSVHGRRGPCVSGTNESQRRPENEISTIDSKTNSPTDLPGRPACLRSGNLSESLQNADFIAQTDFPSHFSSKLLTLRGEGRG